MIKSKSPTVKIMSQDEAKKFLEEGWQKYLRAIDEQGYEDPSHQNVPNEVWYRATEV